MVETVATTMISDDERGERVGPFLERSEGTVVDVPISLRLNRGLGKKEIGLALAGVEGARKTEQEPADFHVLGPLTNVPTRIGIRIMERACDAIDFGEVMGSRDGQARGHAQVFARVEPAAATADMCARWKSRSKPSNCGFGLIFLGLTALEDAFRLGAIEDFEELIVAVHPTLLELGEHFGTLLHKLIYSPLIRWRITARRRNSLFLRATGALPAEDFSEA
jgi:hypothetical protein